MRCVPNDEISLIVAVMPALAPIPSIAATVGRTPAALHTRRRLALHVGRCLPLLAFHSWSFLPLLPCHARRLLSLLTRRRLALDCGLTQLALLAARTFLPA